MPTYRSITTSLVSQFDLMNIPEYEPPKIPIDPFLNAPTLVNHDHSLVSVYIPTYPGSQFWLCYSISPPYPPKMLYYFKLYINGTHIVSWGCGEEDRYEGKTMFGLFDAGPGPGPQKRHQVERRVLCFGPDQSQEGSLTLENLKDVLEIKVFRSKGRKSANPAIPKFGRVSGKVRNNRNKSQLHSSGNGINLVDAGLLLAHHPFQYYKYALLDPLNRPFATFRYYYRSWNQLEALGVISSPPATETSSINSRLTINSPFAPVGISIKTDDSYSFDTTRAQIATENASIDTFIQPPGGTTSIADDSTNASSSSTPSTTTSPSQDFTSPLRAHLTTTTTTPPLLPRPPTPPPFTTPSNPAHPPLPLPDPSLNTLTSKESFASLVRTRLPSPDPSVFQLHDVVGGDEAGSTEATAPKERPVRGFGARDAGGRDRSASMSALMGVVSSARRRRGRGRDGDSSAGHGGGVAGTEGAWIRSRGEGEGMNMGTDVSMGEEGEGVQMQPHFQWSNDTAGGRDKHKDNRQQKGSIFNKQKNRANNESGNPDSEIRGREKEREQQQLNL